MSEDLDVSYQMRGKNEHFDYHSHHENEIYFFHAGACRYLIHNQIYDLEPGDILLMDGLTLHRPNIFPHKEYVRSVIHFSPHMIQDILNTLGSTYLLDVFKTSTPCLIRTKENKQSKQLEDLIASMAQVQQLPTKHNPTKPVELKMLLVQALIIIHKIMQTNNATVSGTKDIKSEHAENIATYIQNNFMKPLNLYTIARSLNLSKSYASHLFKEMTGFTIMEYVMECRLNEAKYLLEMEPDKTIKNIAYDCGFESAAHFSRYFRSKVGNTARAYRQARRATFKNQ